MFLSSLVFIGNHIIKYDIKNAQNTVFWIRSIKNNI